MRGISGRREEGREARREGEGGSEWREAGETQGDDDRDRCCSGSRSRRSFCCCCESRATLEDGVRGSLRPERGLLCRQ